MSGLDSTEQQPRLPHVSGTGGRLPRQPASWIGLLLTLLGVLLIVAALFVPWLDVYKNDPSLLVAKQGYSPWLALQRHGIDAFGVLIGLYFTLVAGLVACTMMLALERQARTRARNIIVTLALIGSGVAILALWGIPVNLELNYPYYDVIFDYGGLLTIAGFLSAGCGAIVVTLHRD